MSNYYSVHPNSIQKVQLAWKRKSNGWDHQLAEELGISLQTVNLFLKGQPIAQLNFVLICQVLGMNWQEIAGMNIPENALTTSPIEVKLLEMDDNLNPSEKSRIVDEALRDLVRTLCEMLSRITRKAGDLLKADRTSIFLLDRERQQLGSIIAEDGGGGSLLIDLPVDKGIASLAATSLNTINIPFDVYEDPRSEVAKRVDERTGYRTYTILAWPLLNEQKDLVAVVQLLNKLKPNYNPNDDLLIRIDPHGFTSEDEAVFAKFVPSIIKVLERCQFCYQLAQKLSRDIAPFQSGVGLKESELIAQLRRQEKQLRQILQRI
ncbi:MULTISPECIES: GAF domain-containing protein [unclassified Coleofasciculus]|uniref:GAF domain-containing protein n=1 Tax=unclassified Coleofasciculus TaxID=2692782 RepID=UPI001880947C|nr:MULTISPECIES: GAF domain-containing protein [unclassified Coleofasciculus]MBE9128055.1 GAF domain-containing protein [Coleofasciculus sp. LEGE 07081]MBE9149342.1 GAF domain-containing protein [Coleofasciculus sp. LEGE 07092]